MSQRSVVLMRCLRNFAPAYGCVRLMDVQRRHQNRPAQVLPARGEGHEVLEFVKGLGQLGWVKVPKQNDSPLEPESDAALVSVVEECAPRFLSQISGASSLSTCTEPAYESLVVCITGMSTATACSQRSPLVRASRGRTRSHHTDWPTDDGLNCFLHV
jgi:hypothetical protein